MAIEKQQQSTPALQPRVAITLLSNADYSDASGKLIHGRAGETITSCNPADMADLRAAGVIVELDDEQQYAVEILRKMSAEKRTLVRNAIGV